MRRMTVYESPEHRMGGEIYYRDEKYYADPELREAYEKGCEHGYRKAHEEMGAYAERHIIGRDGHVINYREHDRDWDDDMEYRRRRSRITGRYM